MKPKDNRPDLKPEPPMVVIVPDLTKEQSGAYVPYSLEIDRKIETVKMWKDQE